MMHYTFSTIAPCGLTQAFRALGLRNISHKLLCLLKCCTTVHQHTAHVHVRCHHCETDGKLPCVGVRHQWKLMIASLWDCSGGSGVTTKNTQQYFFGLSFVSHTLLSPLRVGLSPWYGSDVFTVTMDALYSAVIALWCSFAPRQHHITKHF